MPTISLSEAAPYFGRLSAAATEGARRGLVKAGERGVQVIVTEIIPSRSPQPVDRGTYRAGWKTERVDRDTVAILNPESHAAFIENGVRPENVKIGAALIRALAEWAMRKGLAEDEASATGVAWAIAKTMQQNGIFNKRSGRGLHILGELFEDHIVNIFVTEVSREIQRSMDGVR
jgi:hypothetical protein